ncbi:MAG: phosphoglycerate mutase [bacterium]|nr:phosphoglycerate mutase [bacterium]
MLFAARHAPVAAKGVCYGRHDVPTIIGPEVAARTILGALGDYQDRVTAVWTSPAERCRLPAEQIARSLATPLRVSNDIQEIHYGAWEGQTWETLEREHGDRLKHWMEAWQTEAPPGGENLGDLDRRVRRWLAGTVSGDLLVGHAGVIRALSVILRDLSWEEAMARKIEHLEIDIFERSTLS